MYAFARTPLFRFVVGLLCNIYEACCTTNPQQIEVMESGLNHTTSICGGFVVQLVVQHVVQQVYSKSKWSSGLSPH